MRIASLCLFALISLTACVAEYESPDSGLWEGTEDRYPITVEVELPQPAAASRSSFTDSDFHKITDLNVFLYHNGELQKEHCYY